MLISLCVIEVRVPPTLTGSDCFLHKTYSNASKWTTVTILYVTTGCRLIRELFSPSLLCLFFWRGAGRGWGGGGFWLCVCRTGQLHQHQWSMRLPTCPPWEVVSHFGCFILVLPLLGQREQGEDCSCCILPPPVPWTHHRPEINPSKKKKKKSINQKKKTIKAITNSLHLQLILINAGRYWRKITHSSFPFRKLNYQ